VNLLQKAGLWNDTVLLFTSDNGGELPFADQSKCTSSCLTTGCCGGAGNNYPLRGGKFTLFEGGIRSRSFIHGAQPWIPESRRGSEWHGLAHVSDVFATFAGLAGADVSHATKSSGTGAVSGAGEATLVDAVRTDGFDLWQAIVQGQASPRKEIVHQPINMYWNSSCAASDVSNPFTPSCGGSITVWPYKLIKGFPGDARVVELQPQSDSINNNIRTPRDLCVEAPCLFNIDVDPSESTDLAGRQPDLVRSLSARLHELSKPQAAPQPADALTPVPSDAACAVVKSTGAWQPWQPQDIDSEAYV